MNKKSFVSIAPHRRGLPGKRKFADGGVYADLPRRPRTVDEERRDRILAFGFDPQESMTQPLAPAQTAAPLPVPAAVPAPAPAPPVAPAPPPVVTAPATSSGFTPTPPISAAALPATPPPSVGGVTAGASPATASNAPITTAGTAAAGNAPAPARPIDWGRVLASGGQGALNSGGLPTGMLGGALGDLLYQYLNRRKYGDPKDTSSRAGTPGGATGGAVAMDGYAKGGSVAIEDTEGDSPKVKGRRQRQWSDAGKSVEELPPEKKAKGGAIKRRRPTSKKKLSQGEKLPVPMVTDDDMGLPPPTPPAAAAAAPPPAGPPPPMMKKGGEVEAKKEGGSCDKMAAGGAAKVRHGFPKTEAKPKRMAKGGEVRGCGAATKGKNFSGVY